MSRKRKTKTQVEIYANDLSNRLTVTEVAFLRRLAMGNVGGFDFQVAIGFYIADFVFPSKMLIIEVDGPSHDGRQGYDLRRDGFLNRAGFTVWHVTNSQASTFPLARIREYQRPLTGRPYAEALAWAHREYANKVTPITKRQRFERNTLRLQRDAAKARSRS